MIFGFPFPRSRVRVFRDVSSGLQTFAWGDKKLSGGSLNLIIDWQKQKTLDYSGRFLEDGFCLLVRCSCEVVAVVPRDEPPRISAHAESVLGEPHVSAMHTSISSFDKLISFTAHAETG